MRLFRKRSDKGQGMGRTHGKYSEIEDNLLSGNWEGVKTLAQQQLRAEPRDPIAGLMLGFSEVFMQGFEGAQRRVSERLDSLASDASAPGVFYEWAKELRKRNPDSAETNLVLGIAYNLLDQPKKGISALKQAVKINPHFVEAINEIAGTYDEDLGKTKEAIEWAKRAINIRPDYVDAHLILAHTYIRQGTLREAEEELKECVRLDPQSATAWGDLAGVSLELDSLNEAVQQAQMAIDIDPNHSVALKNLANAKAKLGKLDEATSIYERVLSTTPDDLIALYNLALTLDEAGSYARAVQYYERLLDVAGENLPAVYRQDVEQRLKELKQKAEC